MYYPCSENKDADQLRGYREADLRLCFRPCKLLVFSRTGSYQLFKLHYENMPMQFTETLKVVKNENFQKKNFDIFHIFSQNRD